MYSIERKDGKVVIFDMNGKAVYSAADTAWVISKPPNQAAQPVQVGKLTDQQLLMVLAHAIKLPMDSE